MRLKKVLLGLLFITITLIIAGAIIINSWTRTEHGRLDVEAAILLKVIDTFLEDPVEQGLPASEVRSYIDTNTIKFRKNIIEFNNIKDITIQGTLGSIPLRIYTPDGDTKFPIIVYFHGGGWTIGNLDTHDNLCRSLAKKSSSIVVAVDYRLAPENPFPAAVKDAYDALLWTSKNGASLNGDTGRIAVLGDSAGANLSAVISILARDRRGPKIAYQVLICPGVDLSKMETESYKKFSKGYYLTKAYTQWFRAQYMSDKADWTNPMASPLLTKSLGNLPRAMVITAQFDVLKDEGKAYAERLKEAGVPTVYKCYNGTIHDFVAISSFRKSADALDDIAAELQKAFKRK